ncbi:hypothetical protein V1264_017313 [Littorina saxatilis]|uniref:Uncharacterized protein n=1 Tax=Littorina saxatilis TaxID=31220 RepID=A0AAN9GF95_9CAEN
MMLCFSACSLAFFWILLPILTTCDTSPGKGLTHEISETTNVLIFISCVILFTIVVASLVCVSCKRGGKQTYDQPAPPETWPPQNYQNLLYMDTANLRNAQSTTSEALAHDYEDVAEIVVKKGHSLC